ncbi:MAG: helix-turn-helix domain-containing protein [Oscillospiraceae bacterium]|jgi:transcriptional regulator with XRE-family HTH domain|nr:helix-turn-helix domain-containing protein [Oscillospiraceae bacterium]
MLDEVIEFIIRRIQKMRDSKGISARDLSLSIGQNEGYINKIETKQGKPSLDGLVFVCEYFRITLAEFFDEGTQQPLKVKELLEEIKGLDADSLDLLIGTAKKMKGRK